MLVLSIVEFVVASITFFLCRYNLGYLFSNEKDVVNYVKDMTPFLCVSIVMDSIQAVFSGDFLNLVHQLLPSASLGAILPIRTFGCSLHV